MNSILDQDEIMRSMLSATAKGKQRSVDQDEGSDEEEGSSGEDDGATATSSGSDDNADGDGTQSEGAGPSSPRRSSPRSRSPSGASDASSKSAPVQARVQPTQATMSRVKPQQRPVTGAKPALPFPAAPKPPETTTFQSLGLSTPLITALAGINITRPTEIQAACIKPMMAGRDVIGGAKTGSGKTMAFALPIVERIARDPFGVWAVVLTPTR